MPSSLRERACLVGLWALLAGVGCAAEVDVHVAGYERDEAGTPFAKVWKNGTPQLLSEQPSIATAIAVSGGEVYVAGGVRGEAADAAAFWRNGELVPLTDGMSQAFGVGIAVSGSDVYVAGYEENDAGIPVAMIWRNGEPTALSSGQGEAVARAVVLSGGDVHAVGNEFRSTEVSPGQVLFASMAMYWKNGVAAPLSDGSYAAIARGVAVSGADVHVAGGAFLGNVEVASYWKNGEAVALTDGVYGASATSVCVEGDAVHVGGGEFDGGVDVAKVWRDGVPKDLTYGEEHAWVEAVAARGSDVYAAGHDGLAAVYWKGGERVELTHGETEANARAIAIVER